MFKVINATLLMIILISDASAGVLCTGYKLQKRDENICIRCPLGKCDAFIEGLNYCSRVSKNDNKCKMFFYKKRGK